MVVESRRAGAGRGGPTRRGAAGCGGLRAAPVPSRVLAGCGRREARAVPCRPPAPRPFLSCLERLALPVAPRGGTAASLQNKELDRNHQNSGLLTVWEEFLQMCLHFPPLRTDLKMRPSFRGLAAFVVVYSGSSSKVQGSSFSC